MHIFTCKQIELILVCSFPTSSLILAHSFNPNSIRSSFSHTCLHFRCATKINYISTAWFSVDWHCVNVCYSFDGIFWMGNPSMRPPFNRFKKYIRWKSFVFDLIWNAAVALIWMLFSLVLHSFVNETASKMWLFNFVCGRRNAKVMIKCEAIFNLITVSIERWHPFADFYSMKYRCNKWHSLPQNNSSLWFQLFIDWTWTVA